MDTVTAEKVMNAPKMEIRARSQIVATIGPASWEEPVLARLIDAGMGVARLNFSWGDHEEHAWVIERIRKVAAEKGVRIPIIADLSGPRIQDTDGHRFNPTCDEILTEKDLADLDLLATIQPEYIAMSYVGCGDDIGRVRREMAERGITARVIGKIERVAAFEKLDEIIRTSDAVMVARGDLGNEFPLEQIPYVQRDIIHACKKAGKPVITATQMMLTMVENPTPSRAEVTDVTFAALEGTDAVMLSEEASLGKHPVEAVAMMERILIEAEKRTPDIVRNPL